MSNLYTIQGIDFDTWFGNGTGSQNFDIFTDSGMDVGQVYTAGSGGPDVGFQIASGEDLSTKLGGYGYGIYRVAGLPWNTYAAYKNYTMSVHTNYWTSWLKTWKSKKGSVKCVSGITNDAFGYFVNSNFGYSQLVFAYNPDQTQTMKFSYSWGGKSILGGLPALSDFWCSYIEIDSSLKGIVVHPACDSGVILWQPCYMTLSCTGQETVKYNCYFGAGNDSGVPETNYTGGGWSQGGWYYHA